MVPARIGILLFTATVLLAPLYTAPEYRWSQHLISQLSAQQAPHRWLMSAAFIALGAGILWGALKRWAKLAEHRALPFAAFGLFFAGAGLFAHRPMDLALPFDAFAHDMHGALAALSGTSLAIGFAWDALANRGFPKRHAPATLAALCVLLPLAMWAWPAVQGAIQRAMYALLFGALWFRLDEDTTA